ncbi:FAD-binding oxidoreductase [Planosporangium mesophilum]|uniref:FAD-linked oxidase n=1 Tax=Planosporangium mesophilum TaxID=689768 RepID=A0A8J3TIQ1_9ACTN|nr:FAD-binding oxidoreductase [Planosporangium mesophilum]NJC86592.1 FAD-binding oxidoreductase [Planosporangium mesophilum]GII25379.1 FAD-linked oxidase [Planosporangium mesophilum]
MSVPFDGLVPATDSDVIAGVPARFVAAPTSTEEASAIVRGAAEHGLTTVVRGAGTKQDWAAPPRTLDLIIDTGRLTGVLEHAAGDLITVVRAGTPLSELADKLAPAGQQLAIDAPIQTSTVGGTVAVNMSGPRRMLYGTVRDLLIGVTVVRPDGVVARAGGKVVKNVAGYDLGKLITGSYGTLGLVTECVFRLHPLPAISAYVSRRFTSVGEAGHAVAAVLGAQVVPTAIEVDAGPDGVVEVCVLLEGVPEGVEARVATVRTLLGGDHPTGSDTAPTWWSAYPWAAGDVGIKLTAALSTVPLLLAAGQAARERHGVPLALRGSAGTGVLYASLPGTTEPATVAAVLDDLRAAATNASGHAVVVTAPSPVRDRLDLWGPVAGLDLMRRVKQQFDPDARFAPGRFVGGI